MKRPHFIVLFILLMFLSCKTEERSVSQANTQNLRELEWIAHEEDAFLDFNIIDFFDENFNKIGKIDLIEQSPQAIHILAITNSQSAEREPQFVKVKFKGEEKIIASDKILILAEKHAVGNKEFYVTNGLKSHNTLRYLIVIDENEQAHFITDLQGEYDPPYFFIHQDLSINGWHEILDSIEVMEDGYIFYRTGQDEEPLKKIFVQKRNGEWQASEEDFDETQDFWPKGYEITSTDDGQNRVKADVNKDGIDDYVLLLAEGKNNGDYSRSKDVRLSIFEGHRDGTYRLKSQTGNLTSAFVHFSPEKNLKIADNIISLHHYSMRHDYELKFRYEDEYDDFMLVGSIYNNYDGDSISKNFLATTKNETKPIAAIDDTNIYELISK